MSAGAEISGDRVAVSTGVISSSASFGGSGIGGKNEKGFVIVSGYAVDVKVVEGPASASFLGLHGVLAIPLNISQGDKIL